MVGIRHSAAACLAAIITWAAASATPASAADRPSWQCVPDETLFVVRMPNLYRFYEAIRLQTKLGAVIADEERLADFVELLEQEGGDDWKSLDEAFEKFGLTKDDFRRAVDGEIGYAGLLRPVDARQLYVGLAWLECGTETADKWLAAVDRKLAEQEPGPEAVRRVDVDLAGRKVIRLTNPTLAPKGATIGVQGAVPADDRPRLPPALDGKPEVEMVEIAQSHVLIGRRDTGLLLAHFSTSTTGEGIEAAQRAREAGDDVEAALGVFAAFIESHTQRDEGIVRQWQSTPGLGSALPEGDVLIDALVDVRRIAKLADRPETADLWKFLEPAGLTTVGPAAYRVALDGTILRSGLFLAVPSPRTGLQTLLDQPLLKPEPPGWVSKSAIGYQQISCDLGKAYTLITQIVRDNVPRGAGMITTLENQSQAILQTDPATLLTSLGKIHTILTYLPEVEPGDDAADDDDAAARTATAFVWILPDEAPWRRLMSMLSTATAQSINNEQGFSGLRFEDRTMNAGWFVGNGHMVVAIGKGVTERVLANLRTTPKSDESLRNTPHAQRAAELLPPTGVITYDLTDGAGLLQFADGVMRRAFADTSDEDAAKLQKLWPRAEELSGTIGVSVSATTIDADGVTYRSILELPSP